MYNKEASRIYASRGKSKNALIAELRKELKTVLEDSEKLLEICTDQQIQIAQLKENQK